MATRVPSHVTQVAILPLGPPYKSLTFYEEQTPLDVLLNNRTFWVNTDGRPLTELKQSVDWSTVHPVDGTTTITPSLPNTEAAPTTVVVTFTATPTGIANVVNMQYWAIVTNTPQSTYTTAVEAKAASTGATNGAATSAAATSATATSDDKPPTQTTTSDPSINSIAAATSSSSTSGPASSTAAPKSDGIKPGAAAGIGIGCLVAGALIAGLLAWFCMKRRPSTSGVRDSEASTVALMHREKGPMAKAVSVSSGSPIASALENGLPQPLEDKAISGEISKISNLIKNHVQSYYHSRAVSPGMIDYDDLQALGESLPISVGTLSTLLNNSATREIALRFVLAWVVTSRIQLDDSSNTTFLPPEVAKCMQSMNNAEHGSRAQSLFYTKWRALTAELLQPTYVRNSFSAGDGRIRNIQAAAALLDSVLRPFADSRMDDGARSRNLEEMLKRSAQFALTLFSQPATWNFDWQNEQGVKSGSLCIFPALVQVADENGEPLHPPRPFSEAVNRRLDE